jgi:ubiquinone/menaquinone biosynthesis C-methylase UbiE
VPGLRDLLIAESRHLKINVMEHSAAVNLIRNKYISQASSRWADLGAGDGTFTLALADLLSPSSVIEAIDQNSSSLKEIPSSFNGVMIEKKVSDLVALNFQSKYYDGIIMANTLHFFKDQDGLLRKITKSLKASGILVIVEYEVETPSRWIPYPISYHRLRSCLSAVGFRSITKLDDHPSIYHGRTMYSALAMSPDLVEFQQQDGLA